MRRMLLGIVWFIVFWIGLTLLMSIGLAIYLYATTAVGSTVQEGQAAALGFAAAHAGLIRGLRWVVLLLALLAAVVGTLKGLLPGTRKRAA